MRLNKTSLAFSALRRQYRDGYANLYWCKNKRSYRPAFPKASFIVSPYELLAREPDCFRALLSRLGIEDIPDAIVAEHHNVGIRGHALELSRVANECYSGKQRALVREFMLAYQDGLGPAATVGLPFRSTSAAGLYGASTGRIDACLRSMAQDRRKRLLRGRRLSQDARVAPSGLT